MKAAWFGFLVLLALGCFALAIAGFIGSRGEALIVSGVLALVGFMSAAAAHRVGSDFGKIACPSCREKISAKATRCPKCTSEITADYSSPRSRKK